MGISAAGIAVPIDMGGEGDGGIRIPLSRVGLGVPIDMGGKGEAVTGGMGSMAGGDNDIIIMPAQRKGSQNERKWRAVPPCSPCRTGHRPQEEGAKARALGRQSAD